MIKIANVFMILLLSFCCTCSICSASPYSPSSVDAQIVVEVEEGINALPSSAGQAEENIVLRRVGYRYGLSAAEVKLIYTKCYAWYLKNYRK